MTSTPVWRREVAKGVYAGQSFSHLLSPKGDEERYEEWEAEQLELKRVDGVESVGPCA